MSSYRKSSGYDSNCDGKYINYYYFLKKYMPTSVALTPHFESLTQGLVASGRYNNASEVVRDGLRLLESRVQAESAKLVALRDASNVFINRRDLTISLN